MKFIRGETIGFGTFSSVSIAKNTRDSGKFPAVMAVKSANTNGAATLTNEKSVLDECGDCPEIVRCYGEEITVENGEKIHNLLLEYASRGSLAFHLKKLGGEGLSEYTVRRNTRSVLRGLRHIHAKGFAHCDLKLENILLFKDGAVKIADFGLARRVDGVLTASNEGVKIRGTPLYMAPESVNYLEYGSASDVWALGCAVVEMYSGQTAWSVKEGSNFMSLLIRIGLGDDLPMIPEELSEEGKDFLSKCFDKDPKKRWTAEMLLDHSFVAVDCDDYEEAEEEYDVKVKEEEEVLKSPKCPFEFPEWKSVSSESQLQYQPLQCTVDRFGSLVGESIPDWSFCENWITVRCPRECLEKQS